MALKTSQDVKDMQTATVQWNRYVRARDNGHTKYVTMAKKCDDYYQGNQWDQDDVDKLTRQGRPALTVNTILPTVNAFLGEQSSRRVSFRVKPKRASSNELASVMTKIMQHVADENNLHWVESQVFSDGLIMDGRGYYDVRMDFSDNVEGEIRIKALDPLDVLVDPDAKEYDPSTWNEVFYSRWHTIEEIKEMYGAKKASKLEFLAENGNYFDRDSIEFERQSFGDVDESTYHSSVPHDEEASTMKALRVIERQHMKVVRRDYFVDPETGDQSPVPGAWGERKVKKFAKQFGLTVISKAAKRVRWTVTCDKVVLHDEWSPYDSFTIIPYFAYFRRGKPFGMIRNLISSQEQLNKVSSQELHIVNTTANSGWLVQSGSLANMDPDDLEDRGAETGLVIEYARGSEAPAKISPNTIPTGLDRISAKAMSHIRTISGVSDSMLGTDSPEVSGVAIEKKRDVGLNLMQVPLENLAYTRTLLAEKIKNLIQRYYTERRVFHIVKDEDDPREPREELVVNEEQEDGTVYNDLTQGDYETIITTAPARDTYDEVQFAEAIAMRSAGVAIPDDIIVRYSNLDKREEIAKRLRIQSGVEMTPEQQEQAAIQNQIAMINVQLEIGKLEAEIQKIQSETELNRAKVGDMTQVQPNLELTRLQTELQTRLAELDLRRELSEMTNQTRLQQSEQNMGLKLATTAMTTASRQQPTKTGESSNGKTSDSSD